MNADFMNQCPSFSDPVLFSHLHQSIYINRQIYPYNISIIALECSVFCFKLCYPQGNVAPRLSVATFLFPKLLPTEHCMWHPPTQFWICKQPKYPKNKESSTFCPTVHSFKSNVCRKHTASWL